MSVQADLKKHGSKGLWDLYLNESKYHIHRGDNMDLVIFSDALALQGARVIENVMKYLKCDRNRAIDIVFKDTREKEQTKL